MRGCRVNRRAGGSHGEVVLMEGTPISLTPEKAPNLTPADLAMFLRLGIPAELLNRAGIERVTDREARERFGIVGYGDMSGIVFPYMDPMNGHRWTARVRRDNPEIEGRKPRNKYISAYGDRRHLYFPPGSAELMHDPAVPIVLVEAEKSALALVTWAARMGRKLLPVADGRALGMARSDRQGGGLKWRTGR